MGRRPPAPSTSSVSAACGSLGLQLGSTMRESGGRLLDVVAKLTGKTTADVTAERQAGKTFTQIAAENDVSSDGCRRRGAQGAAGDTRRKGPGWHYHPSSGRHRSGSHEDPSHRAGR